MEDNPGRDFSFLENLPKMEAVISSYDPNAKPSAFHTYSQVPTKSVAKSEASSKTDAMDCDPTSFDEPILGRQAPSDAAGIFRGFEGTMVQADAQPDFVYNDGTFQQELRHLQNARERAFLLDGYSYLNMFNDGDALIDAASSPFGLPPLSTSQSAPTGDIMMQGVVPSVSFGPSFDSDRGLSDEIYQPFMDGH